MLAMHINGFILDKYRIEKLIGNGTFSAVFKAKEKMCNRTVAIKALYKDTYKKGVIKYLEAETKSMGLLWGHPNIVAVHTVEPGDENYIAYIVMEYIGGPDLRELIRQKDSIPLEDIICIGIDICNALSHAHFHNIIHRDIKPKNILLTEDLSAKLSDFSVAQILEESRGYTGTVGTRRYMAPEQYMKNYDYRIDIYATGLILLEMCVGHLPFVGLTPEEIEWQKRTGDITIPDSVPSCLRTILQKATQRDVRKRYQTAADLRDSLDGIRLKLYELHVKDLIEQNLNPTKFKNSLRRKQASLRLPSLVASNIERDVENDLRRYQYHLNKREIEEQSMQRYRLAKQYLFEKKIGNALSEIRKIAHLNIVDEKQAKLMDELCSELTETLKNSIEQIQLSRQVAMSDINESNYLRVAKLYERSSQYEKVAETFLTAAKKFENSDNIKNAKRCYKKAAKFYKKHAVKLSYSDSLEKVAQCYKKAAQAYKNVESYWKARRTYEKAAENYERLAEIFEANQKWGQAGNYFFEALELYQKAKKAKKIDAVRKRTVVPYFERAQELYNRSELEGAYQYCSAAVRLSAYIKGSCIVGAEAREFLEKIESTFRANSCLG